MTGRESFLAMMLVAAAAFQAIQRRNMRNLVQY